MDSGGLGRLAAVSVLCFRVPGPWGETNAGYAGSGELAASRCGRLEMTGVGAGCLGGVSVFVWWGSGSRGETGASGSAVSLAASGGGLGRLAAVSVLCFRVLGSWGETNARRSGSGGIAVSRCGRLEMTGVGAGCLGGVSVFVCWGSGSWGETGASGSAVSLAGGGGLARPSASRRVAMCSARSPWSMASGSDWAARRSALRRRSSRMALAAARILAAAWLRHCSDGAGAACRGRERGGRRPVGVRWR